MSPVRRAVTPPEFDNDVTVVDESATDSARQSNALLDDDVKTVTRPAFLSFNEGDDVKTVMRPAFESFDADVKTVMRPALESFDGDVKTAPRQNDTEDLPTKIWTPRPRKPASVPATPIASARRLRSVTDTGPSVQVEPSHVAQTAWRDDPTRIEAVTKISPQSTVPSVAPTTEETTAPGTSKRRTDARHLSPIGMACAALIALTAASGVVSWHRQHLQTGAVAAAPANPRAATTSQVAPPRAAAVAPVAVAPMVASPAAPSAGLAASPIISAAAPPAHAPASAPVPAAPATPAARAVTALAPVTTGASAAAAAPASPEELAAVEAIESGDLRNAARLYAALAAAHPTNEAYREAARILLDGAKETHL